MVETGKREKEREGGEIAILVGVTFPGDPMSHEHPLDELARLVDTAGATVAGRLVQRRAKPDASTFLGKGKAEEAAELAREVGADLVVTDADLSPAQLRNLERILDVRVVDRTELILDIFALHARSHQAKLQVELAQAQYVLPRLRRMWTHLSREGGGGQSAAIGSRGPGEKQIEIDRRLLRKRISDLKQELSDIAERRERMAASRKGYFKVSLVGYTNAGKSTLLRGLTGQDAYIADQLFATLDTQTRAWTLGNAKRVFLSDTVGFIRNLPHHLVASFYATLEEVRVADLILHVVDGSHPDARLHMEAVEHVMGEVGVQDVPRILVLNKVDRVQEPLELRHLAQGRAPSVCVSARSGEGLDELTNLVERHIRATQDEAEFRIPASEGKLLAWLADRGTVLRRDYDDGMVSVRVRLGAADMARAGRMVEALDGSDAGE